MNGLINRAVKKFILKEYGKYTWEEICYKSKVEDDVFVSMKFTEDSHSYRLIETTSEVLGVEPSCLIESIGKYWVEYTESEGYSMVFEMFGKSMKEFMHNLNHLHFKIGCILPNIDPPTFDTKVISDSQINLHYYSNREGMAPLVKGILAALSNKFNEPCDIIHLIKKSNETDHDVFQINFL